MRRAQTPKIGNSPLCIDYGAEPERDWIARDWAMASKLRAPSRPFGGELKSLLDAFRSRRVAS
jgi:hypothetical protein